jgi:mannose-6-phosphate isomerase-like protein (cupin superfamily)
MAKIIEKPTEIKAHGNKLKIIQEFIGKINTDNKKISIARMNSPQGWSEPGQTPQFDEYTIVLKGTLCINTKEKIFNVEAGQAFFAAKGQWVQYSTPHPGGSQYIAVCVPAFSPELVHRDSG